MRWLITDLDHTLIYPMRKRPLLSVYGESIAFQRNEDVTRGMIFPNQLKQLVYAMSDKRVAITARHLHDVNKLDMGFGWDYIISTHGTDIYQTDSCIKSFLEPADSECIAEIHAILDKEIAIADDGKITPREIRCVYSGKKQNVPAFIEIKFHDTKDISTFISQYQINHFINDEIELLVNGDVMTLKPRLIDKARALSFLISNHIEKVDKAPLLIGAGDSLSDLPFMKLCHLCMAPSQSQIIQHI